jgi:hypothetical protein
MVSNKYKTLEKQTDCIGKMKRKYFREKEYNVSRKDIHAYDH